MVKFLRKTRNNLLNGAEQKNKKLLCGSGTEKFMSDEAKTGAGKKTLWQFIKFIFVSLLAMIVQYGLLNIFLLLPFIKEMFNEPFSKLMFNYPVNKDDAGLVVSGGLGYFIAFNVSNILAQIVAFFVNREKTFKSGANIAVTLPIYIVFTIALICFSAWLSPTLNTLFISKGVNGQLSANIAAMVCSAIQFFAYFPVSKILFRKPKEEK